MIPEPGAIYVMDRGYLDFERLFNLHRATAFFITRSKTNTKLRRLYSRPVDKACGLRSDQTVVLTGYYSKKRYPDQLCRVRYFDDDQKRHLVFLTNNFTLTALTVADLYRCRCQVELFFKWIKQHLRIKAFYGTSENAVKTQIWLAVSVYVLVAILRKRLGMDQRLHTILQILSLTLFEKVLLFQLLDISAYNKKEDSCHIQLKLYDS